MTMTCPTSKLASYEQLAARPMHIGRVGESNASAPQPLYVRYSASMYDTPTV